MEPQLPSPIKIRQGAYLPHWTQDGATYSITYRLADSLPQSVLQGWLDARANIVGRALLAGRPLGPAELKRLEELHSERIERYLDAGTGECLLRLPSVAAIVRESLQFFDCQRYRLHAWCIMPNHVHVVAEPLEHRELPTILHTWKSFTPHAINKHLGRKGQLWQDEYYDHLIRDAQDFAHAVQYVTGNPEAAGIHGWPWVWARPGAIG